MHIVQPGAENIRPVFKIGSDRSPVHHTVAANGMLFAQVCCTSQLFAATGVEKLAGHGDMPGAGLKVQAFQFSGFCQS